MGRIWDDGEHITICSHCEGEWYNKGWVCDHCDHGYVDDDDVPLTRREWLLLMLIPLAFVVGMLGEAWIG